MAKGLTQELIAATGLPQDPVEREFNKILERYGKSQDELTLEELREVMADYLQIVFLELAEENRELSA
ncbi:hypothetical protein AZI86_06795 [Bdellovibrio bacteriovorus]|uniref:Uncharacterized protein n=1 Tax=Bdellovibrio bacteriovorus TaxID=959 RepID=A0A150WRB4_BDEBC|nr:hypothetical protein [Bdellovibrio bacteriovorus]KYG66745.1 hypothetical protein AZI86_06795 [Bdellovibrio bacteriovorus]